MDDEKIKLENQPEIHFQKVIIPEISNEWLFEYSDEEHIINWNTTPEVAAIRPEIKSALTLGYFTNRYYNNAD